MITFFAISNYEKTKMQGLYITFIEGATLIGLKDLVYNGNALNEEAIEKIFFIRIYSMNID